MILGEEPTMKHQRRDFLTSAALGSATMAGLGASMLQGDPGTMGVSVAASNAPQAMKSAADFVCSGSNDHVQINQAIERVSAPGSVGGVVSLSPGTFNCGAPVRTQKRVTLAGAGWATRLVAKFGGFGGVIVADSDHEDKMTVAHLAIIGEGRDTNGILWNITSNAGFDEGSPDASNHISDVYVSNVRRSGIVISGPRNRGCMVERARVLNAGQRGFNITSPDGFYDQCETGSAGWSGFNIANANNRFTNCKAWFSDRSGFMITGVRNQFAACESQDNEQHGFNIQAGQVSLTSCHADSNSWKAEGPRSAYDGFYIARNRSFVQLVGCQAYDKNESGRGHWQRWGFNLAGGNKYCQIVGSAHLNRSGKLRNGAGGANSIEVLGP